MATPRQVEVKIVGDASKLAADPAPFPGKLKVGAHGPAVIAVQQALEDFGTKRKKTHPHEDYLRLYAPTGEFRNPTAFQCGHAQEVFGLVKTNTYGEGLHRHLASHFNAHSRKLLQDLHHESLMDAFYVELNSMQHHTAGFTMNETSRAGWSYHMDGQRFSIIRNGWDFDTVPNAEEDCSSGGSTQILIARRRVGLPDPKWWIDHGVGCYTGNLINYGRVVALRDIKIGDRVHYGNNSHLGVYMGRVQGTPAVWSFGGEPGPLPRPLTYRGIYGIRRDDE